MFNWAIRNGKATENPIKRVRMLKEENTRTRYLNREEMRRLLDACPTSLERVVMCALLTGMRRGEILSLKWDDVNLQHGVILLKHTKSGRMREIPISGALEKVLLECHENTDGVYVFCEQGKPYKGKRIDYIFPNILRMANIQDFCFHDLRHTAASYMVMSGLDLATVRDILGHKKIDMTLRYAHLAPVHKREAMEILGSKMDAIWTPAGSTEEVESKEFENLIGNIKVSKKQGDAQVSKRVALHIPSRYFQ